MVASEVSETKGNETWVWHGCSVGVRGLETGLSFWVACVPRVVMGQSSVF